MLVDPPMEEMLPKTACAYELAVLVAQRACQLVDGAQPMVGDSAANMVSLACREIAQGKVAVVKGDHKAETVIPKTKAAREKAAREEADARKAREEAESLSRLTAAVEAEAEKEQTPTDIQFDTLESDDAETVFETVSEDEE